jgi:hypothetical protein
MAHIQLRKGDLLLLCSDGLHDYFPVEQELADRIVGRQPEEALAELIELAKDRGGHDNITGVIVEVMECEPVQTIVDPGQLQAGLTGNESTAAPDKVIEREDTMPVDVTGKKEPVGQRHGDPMAAVHAEDDTMEIAVPTEAIAKIEAERAAEKAAQAGKGAPEADAEPGDSGPKSRSG